MTGLVDWLAMGGYWAYVWPAYGIAALVLGGLTLQTVRRHARAQAHANALEPRASLDQGSP